jgi:hypothetical protein
MDDSRLIDGEWRWQRGIDRTKKLTDSNIWGSRYGCFEAFVQWDSSRKMSKKHVKMNGVVRADSMPAANATHRHQYIASKQMT